MMTVWSPRGQTKTSRSEARFVRVVFDLETTATADLRRTGAHAYAEHGDTRVTVLCACEDDDPVFGWWWGQPIRPWINRFERWVQLGAVFVAHNYLFEWNVYHLKLVPLGFPPIPLRQWSCTMARSLVAGFPSSLDAAARAARLPVQKDTSARDLMLRMARPRTLYPEVTWWHETSPQHLQRLHDYCAQDVLTERALDKAVAELSPRERRVFEADHAINQRGLQVDLDLVERMAEHAQVAKRLSEEEVTRATNGQITAPTQVQRIKTYLVDMGVDLPDLRRHTLRLALQGDAIVGPPRSVLQARLDASRSSTAKLSVIQTARSLDGRLKGTFQYYGAGRTGRAAGRRFQPQNLFRGSIKDVAAAVRLIKGGIDTEGLGLLFEDSPMGVLASCLRSCIVAPAGHKLVICDFSQIEARVLAWLANESYALECFARGDDIYTETAKAIGSSSRQLGKVLVLACGYGMGATVFQLTAATFGLVLTLEEAQEAVQAWRQLNERIVDFWWACNRVIRQMVNRAPGTEIRVGRIVFRRHPDAVLIRLPSGRYLVYRRPGLQRNENIFGAEVTEFVYMGSHGGDWVQLRAWPGKTVENITQAVARDVLADAMVDLHDQGVPLVAQVHDELVAEARDAECDNVYSIMQHAMSKPPGWGPTLPLAAAGFVGQRYVKAA